MRRGHGDSALGLGELEKLENDWASSVASGMGGSRHDKAGADALDEFEQPRPPFSPNAIIRELQVSFTHHHS